MDYRLEQWINGPAGTHGALDTLMKALASGAEVFFLLVVVAWFLYGWLRRSPTDREGAIAALLAAGLALAVNQVVGMAWNRPRPFVAHPGSVHLLLSHSTDPSFPSDHAAAAFAIAAVLLAVRRRWAVAALLVAAAVCYARVYVGDHYPGDVAGGALIGVVAALVLMTWLRILPRLGRRLADTVLVRLHAM